MDKITRHHYQNIADDKTVKHDDGELSTVFTTIVEVNGKQALLPLVWDGQIDDAHVDRAINEGVYELFDTVEEAEAFDREIHKQMKSDTTPEQARSILKDAGFNDGGGFFSDYNAKSEMPKKDDYWFDANYVKDASQTYAKNRRIEEGTNRDEIDNKYDAMRHIGGTMGLMAEYPEIVADAMLYGNEGTSLLSPNRDKSLNMDLHNNEVGRKLFEQIPEEQLKDMDMEDFMQIAENHLNAVADAELSGAIDDIPVDLRPVYYWKEPTVAKYSEGGSVDDDPLMVSDAGIEEGDSEVFKDALTFAAEMAPGTGEVLSAKDAYDSYQEGDYLGAALGAVGAIPGVGIVGRAAKKGAKTAARASDEIMELARGMLDEAVEAKVPNKTVKAYKLFKAKATKPDEYFPLFVRANESVPVGEWTPAKMGKLLEDGSVDSEIGALAFRPGWHAGDYASATHIGGKATGKGGDVDYRKADQIWAEVEMGDDVDWQKVADDRARIKADGEPDASTAHITDQIPEGGFYRYKTNPNMQGNWMIGGEMKVNRVMTPDEVKRIGEETGQPDLPLLPDLIEQKGLSFDDLSGVAKQELKSYYPEVFKKLAPPELQPKKTAKPKWFQASEEPKELYHGGLLSEEDYSMSCGMMGPDYEDVKVGVDPVSGNPVPPGSNEENVRDDIPAVLSDGEYVVPADVVRYHGLKTFMDLRAEAKSGLMSMMDEGQIKSLQEEDEDEAEYGPDDQYGNMEEYAEDMEEDSGESGVDDGGDGVDDAEPRTTPEGNEVSDADIEGYDVEVEAMDAEEEASEEDAYPTSPGQFSFGDERVLVLMASDGGLALNEGATVTKLIRKAVRDPKTGKLKIIFMNPLTGATVSAQDAMGGNYQIIDQGTNMPDTVSAEKKEEEEEDTTAGDIVESARDTGGESDGPAEPSAPVDRSLENNYGYTDPKTGALISAVLPGPLGLLAGYGMAANNTSAVNAARADLGLDPLDTTLGINRDAVKGNVATDYNIGPYAADVTMQGTYTGKQSPFESLLSSVGLTNAPTTSPTSSTLTPAEIQEKRAAGLTQDPTTGQWGYSAEGEARGLATYTNQTSGLDASNVVDGYNPYTSTADNYGMSLASERGREEATNITNENMDVFDANDDGKLDANEMRDYQEFTSSEGPARGVTQEDIDAQGAAAAGYDYSGNNDNNTNDTNTDNNSDPSSGMSDEDAESAAAAGSFGGFNKGGLAYKPRQKVATLKR